MKVAFIGLGIMGKRMALNLARKEVDLVVFNRSSDPYETMELEGVPIAPSVPEAVGQADVVFTMLSTPEVVEKMALEDPGFLTEMQTGALWVDCTTVNPSFSERMARAAQKHGIRYIDAPVAGSKQPAERGELTFLVGGDPHDIKQITPYLECMGRKTIHAGHNGKGSALKMLLNAMLAESMVAFAETVILGQRLGFEQDFLLDLLPSLPIVAPFTKAKAAKIKSNDYTVEFPLEWMHKDLHLVTLTAYENDTPLLMANLVKELYAKAKQEGLDREDFSAIFKYLDR